MIDSLPLIGQRIYSLFDSISPYRTGMLPVDARHELYFEECGNPKGVPIVFLHGGPGAGASPVHRQFFDPEYYRIVVFDQRGAGRSTPQGETRDNTTQLLVEDMERLRKHLNVDRWFVFGGSWGSTLAMAYAQSHADRVRGLILRGIFLGRPAEVDWFMYGIASVFPEAWRAFANHIPKAERHDLLSAYCARLDNTDPNVHGPAARVWAAYEGSCSCLVPNLDLIAGFASDRVALGLARIEAHYFKNRIFLAENELLDRLHTIRHIPATIVQGRYDMVCPFVSAYDLHLAWPEAQFMLVTDAGHSAFEPGTRSALVRATERMKTYG